MPFDFLKETSAEPNAFNMGIEEDFSSAEFENKPEQTQDFTVDIAPQETTNTARQQIGAEVASAAGGIATNIIGGAIQKRDLERARKEARGLADRERDIRLKQQAEINKLRYEENNQNQQKIMIEQQRQIYKRKHDRFLGEMERILKSQSGIRESAKKLNSALARNDAIGELIVSQWRRGR